ncbi:single-stranded-DNA-specific exonuclease RecJ [Methanosphaera sp. WGK6]|uniref:single-stranded-DNA-specific exonuclease RecJ n=1 Tax=Methanosphaera sp. WGK6 TaxID=1561964 RepID=UPI00084BE752|nr:single-stranded-DNA-specific exonuclease RecJ [Methanosphaera sp. WGK6]OED30732.1 single-stranded DNA-binding protein [Methanosphaera sp. WGK6]
MSETKLMDIKESRSHMDLLFNKAKEKILDSEDITVYTHTDCDGITAGSILSSILDKLDINHSVNFVEINEVEHLTSDTDVTIISDLGAGQNIENILDNSNKTAIILDHHPPIRKLGTSFKGDLIEINPNYYGLDGSYTISGGGLSYFLAKSFQFHDLSWMGILSAVGDMQNSMTGKLRGLNTEILNDGMEFGCVDYVNDLLLYGRHTRPLFVALSYFGDIHLPLTNNRNECIHFLENLGIPVKNDLGNVRYLCDLNMDEKGKLFNELLKMMTREVPERYVKYVPKLISGESYEFTFEEKYTSFRDASEYSTVINACGRNNRHELGMEVIKGNRNKISNELESLVKDHKRYLAQNMTKLQDANSVEILDNIQYFDGDGIKASVVGTIAGMLLSNYDWQKPIVGYTHIDDETAGYKVSLRCSKLLGYDGIHYGNLVRDIATKCGGSGGGHSVACGAYIPEDNIEQFISLLNNSVNLN